MKYRVIAVVSGGLALAACSSVNLDIFKSGPVMETVQFESQPPGAEVKVSNGQTCRTPCALALPKEESVNYTLTFTLNGYLPATEQLQAEAMGDGTLQLRPNPVVVQLTPTPPPPKPKKAVHRKPAAKKPKPKAKPAALPPAGAPPPSTAAPAGPSPWPPAQPTR